MLDREYIPDQGRVLYSVETGFAPDAPADVLARPLVIDCEPEPAKRDVVGALRRPDPLRRERPAVIPRDLRWRTAPRTLRPMPKRGPSPVRYTHVTVASIQALQAEGKKVPEIAALLQCSVDIVYKRLRTVKPPRVRFEAVEGYVFPGSVLTVIRELLPENHARKVLCRCQCGAQLAVQLSQATSGSWKSCGCLRRKLTPEIIAAIWQKRSAGARVIDLCREYGISDETVRRAERMARINTPAQTVDKCT